MNWRSMAGRYRGFTMSLFIGGMAFSDPQQFEDAKLGIPLSSLIAAIHGRIWLYFGAADRKE